MVRYYCDCCGKEVTSRRNKIPFKVHIFDEEEFGGYMDSEWNKISGIEKDVEACTECYNRIMGQAKEVMEKIQEENDIKTDKKKKK